MRLNCFSGYELHSDYIDCLKSNIACVIMQGSLQCAIYIHGHVPTWIKDASHFNNLLSLRKMFWLASRSLTTLALKHPPVHSCVDAGPTTVKAVIRGAGWDDDSFIKGPHLIIPKSGHMDTQEERLLYSGSWRSDLSHASHHKPFPYPEGSPFTWTGYKIFDAYTEEISAHLVCQSRPVKPVYVLNTVGTLDIPDRHCHRPVITAISASY